MGVEIFYSFSQLSFHLRGQSAMMFVLSAVRTIRVTNLCVCLISNELKKKKNMFAVELADLIECRSA